MDLLHKMNSAHIFLSRDAHITALVHEALKELSGISQHVMPHFEDLYPPGTLRDDKVGDILETPTYDAESAALILHSSGA